MTQRSKTDKHPEEICNRCGGANVSWSAPSPLWNEVMRGGYINGKQEFGEIICPTCFAILAAERGVASGWRFYAAQVYKPLQTVTPLGRVWDNDKWLWVYKSAHPSKTAPIELRQKIGDLLQQRMVTNSPIKDVVDEILKLLTQARKDELKGLLEQKEPVISDDDPDEDIEFEAVPELLIKRRLKELERVQQDG